MIPPSPRLYAALGAGLLIVALVVWGIILNARLDTSREQLKNEQLAHGITLASLKGATDALKSQTAAIRELDRLGQARKAASARALQDSRAAAVASAPSIDRLKASAASVRAPDAPCMVSEAVRAVEGKL